MNAHDCGALRRRRVGINAHLLSAEASYRRAGISRYIARVLENLPPEQDLHPIVYTRARATIAGATNLAIVGSGWPTERRSIRILWEQIVWPYLALRGRLDLLHSMAFVTPIWAPCRTVVTVYDLSFLHYPEQFPFWQRLYLTSQTRRSCRRAGHVIAISESGRQDVHHYFQVPLTQIAVIYPGVDPQYRLLARSVVERFRQRKGLTRPFILHVGTIQPRKNIPILLQALAYVDRPDLKLVLIGGKGWLYEDVFDHVKRLNLQEQVIFAGYVPDEELPLWYNAAAILVFPSIYEGFGMPVVEAMACGTPVIAANISSLLEAGGQAAMLFDPRDGKALGDCIVAVLDDAFRADKMRQAGLRQAQKFSWEKAGRETAAVYRRALGNDE